ncbi:MAG: CpsD/CapB family tyrosine-protein kinase [Chloroflexi bacterium]|nr:CpsD/CapB family tyrosine-protein kinase [Chloroflexota bacterium]
MDDTVKTPEQLARLTSWPTLAGIAEIRSDPTGLISISKPRSPTSEAYRVLRTAIQFALNDDNRILLVSSAVPEEGKSTTAANLAVVMAQAGNRVLLVDADLRRPSQHKMFGLNNKKGLASVITGYDRDDSEDRLREILGDATQETAVNGLNILSCGPIPPNPSEVLVSRKMDDLLEVAVKDFDFIILDSPPVLAVTDATILSAKADAMLLVVKSKKSRKEYVKQVTSRLTEVNANVLGWVLNALTPKSEGHSAYYYYRDPYYADSNEDEGVEAEGVVIQEKTPRLKKFRKRVAQEQTA